MFCIYFFIYVLDFDGIFWIDLKKFFSLLVIVFKFWVVGIGKV